MVVVVDLLLWDCSSWSPDFKGKSQGKASSNPTAIVRHLLFLRKGFSLIKDKNTLVEAEWRFKAGSVSLVETTQRMQSSQCKSPGIAFPTTCQEALPENNLSQLILIFNLKLLIM